MQDHNHKRNDHSKETFAIKTCSTRFFILVLKFQGAESLDCLLSVDGCRQLKSMCFKNLDMKAKEANEVAMLTRFMERAKEVFMRCNICVYFFVLRRDG